MSELALVATVDLSEIAARELTDSIRQAVGIVWRQVTRAYHGRAWAALGYSSWDEYCDIEFDGARLRLPREERTMVVGSLADAGLSTRAVAAVVGVHPTTVLADLGSRAGNPARESEDDPPPRVTGRDGKSYPASKPKLKGGGTPSGDTEARAATVREMAASGYSTTQIATAMGYSTKGMQEFLKRHDVEVHADAVVARTYNLNSARIVRATVEQVDGQHRIEALRRMGWEDQQVQCWTYEGMSEQQEAEKFLRLNDNLAVERYARFKVGVTAGREESCEIDRVVRSQKLVVSKDRVPGAVRAVGTLERVYRRTDSQVLGRALRIIRDAYGDPGLEAAVIDGIGYLCGRYNGELDEKIAVIKLGAVHGGVNGLLGKAENIRRQTGNAKGLCVAAAAVEIINSGRGGKRLPAWWKN